MLPGRDRQSLYQLLPYAVRSIDVKGQVKEALKNLI